MSSNISLSSCLYSYANLNSCKYLESEIHRRNAQVNKASSVNKGVSSVKWGHLAHSESNPSNTISSTKILWGHLAHFEPDLITTVTNAFKIN